MSDPGPRLGAPEAPSAADVLIVGAGPVGLTLSRALAGSGLRLLLLDRQPRGAWVKDPRALALSHGSRQLLERFGAWNAAAGTAIREIHVSQNGGFGRTLIEAGDYGIPALGYAMRYRDLVDRLESHLADGQLIPSSQVERIETDGDGATVTIVSQGRTQRIRTRLVVHAEGTPADDPDVRMREYGQHAVVCEVRAATPPAGRAWERFTAEGPLALLPLGAGYAVVFTVPPEKAAQLLALDDAGFLAAIGERLGRRLELVAAGPRAAFPLALRVRRHLVRPRQVWLGNTAQTLHPVSGQGFNLGLRDAWELAEVLLEHSLDDAGQAGPLAAYARGRQPDRLGSLAFTDGVVRLFSNDLPPLRLARGFGLLALDLVPPLRHFVARRMIWGARAWP